MDDASEDSGPAQPGFIKKFFLTMSQVRDLFVAFTLFEFLSVLNDFTINPGYRSLKL